MLLRKDRRKVMHRYGRLLQRIDWIFAGLIPAEGCRSGEASGYVGSHSRAGEAAPSVSIATTIVNREVRSTNRIHLRSVLPMP
jgi:hypothetical protein